MERIRILIVEDDFLNRRLIKKTVSDQGYTALEAKNIEEAVQLLQTEPIHIALLDINLGTDQKNGIWLGNYIKESFAIPFIYITAYDTADIAKNAIQTKPSSFLTKPFKEIDLLASIEIALLQNENAHSNGSQCNTILIKEQTSFVHIPIEKIEFIVADGNYLIIHSEDRIYKSRSTLKDFLKQLPSDRFIRTHRAYIINRAKVLEFNNECVVVGNNQVPISSNYIPDISIFHHQSMP